MKIALFSHSLRSCWNHGTAHFLRGVATDLVRRGHQVRCYEPERGWSIDNLVQDHGWASIREALDRYPALDVRLYDPCAVDLDRELAGSEVVLVHEWNPPELLEQLVERRQRRADHLLLFHDTHHRASNPLSGFDAALVSCEALRRIYLERGSARQVFTWHEAADERIFRPLVPDRYEGDLIWIGNCADDERKEELREFLFEPVRKLGLTARVYGVRYPESALKALAAAGIEYAGWLPSHRVPQMLARFRATVHLPGIPSIRVFEALACGIPLVSARWHDDEQLFDAGRDFLVAQDGDEMTELLEEVLVDPERANSIRNRGLACIRERHACRHRVDQLLSIIEGLGGPRS